jgi:hypothetical protein
MTTTNTYSLSDGRPADSLPPIRVAIFDKGGECYDIVEIPNPAANFAKHWQTFNPDDVVRVLPDEAEGGAA